MRTFLALFLLIPLSLSLFSCGSEDFSHCELHLPLTESYKRTESEGFDAVFTDGVYTVGILRISFDAGFNQGIPETMNAREFALLWQRNSGEDFPVHKDFLTPYYSYFKDGYFYTRGFYRSKYAYFTVLISAPEALYPEVQNGFLEILDGAIFKY